MKHMHIPTDKNRRWVERIYHGIDRLGEDVKTTIMNEAGKSCVPDILRLCATHLGRRIDSVEDLVCGWNMLRETRNLNGRWQLENSIAHGTFYECGCPLVRSGLIDLNPVHCLCSKAMMETIFARVAAKEVEVVMKRAIGRGDAACEFVVRLS